MAGNLAPFARFACALAQIRSGVNSRTVQLIAASSVTSGARKIDIPMLVLRGEWLKAIGFPIGAALYLTTDRRGEVVLNRLGLSLPRRLRIVAKGVTSRGPRKVVDG